MSAARVAAALGFWAVTHALALAAEDLESHLARARHARRALLAEPRAAAVDLCRAGPAGRVLRCRLDWLWRERGALAPACPALASGPGPARDRRLALERLHELRLICEAPGGRAARLLRLPLFR